MHGTINTAGFNAAARAIESNQENLLFVLDRLFHPSVMCAESGGTCSRIEDTVSFLARNLEREERLMAEIDYPELATHKREHEILLRDLGNMKGTLICGVYDNTVLFNFLTKWSEKHIATHDKPFCEFLRQHDTAPIGTERP